MTIHPPITWITFFFFNDTATTEIYTLSLHDALPISSYPVAAAPSSTASARFATERPWAPVFASRSNPLDRKSTRLNSSHDQISYAVFCLKKKSFRQRLSRVQAWLQMELLLELPPV